MSRNWQASENPSKRSHRRPQPKAFHIACRDCGAMPHGLLSNGIPCCGWTDTEGDVVTGWICDLCACRYEKPPARIS